MALHVAANYCTKILYLFKIKLYYAIINCIKEDIDLRLSDAFLACSPCHNTTINLVAYHPIRQQLFYDSNYNIYTRQNIFNTYHFLQQVLPLHSRIRGCCAKCFRRFLAKPRFLRLIRLVTSSQIRELPYKNNNSLLSKHKIT